MIFENKKILKTIKNFIAFSYFPLTSGNFFLKKILFLRKILIF
jgi:hypothetical protein